MSSSKDKHLLEEVRDYMRLKHYSIHTDLKTPLKEKLNAVRAGNKTNIHIIMTRDEVREVMNVMEGVPQLIVEFLYGCGLRIMETGAKERITTFPIEGHKDISYYYDLHPRFTARATRRR